MKRKEEIEKAAREYEASPVGWNNEDIEIRDFFKRGAEWADEHPRKGLVDIDKVCEYLMKNDKGFILTEMSIAELRKAMEE